MTQMSTSRLLLLSNILSDEQEVQNLAEALLSVDRRSPLRWTCKMMDVLHSKDTLNVLIMPEIAVAKWQFVVL